MVAIKGSMGQGKVSEAAKKRTLARKLLARTKANKPFSIDSTTFTLDQWGDTLNLNDYNYKDTKATFVKYNRMDVPLDPLSKAPKSGTRARNEWDRANKAEIEAATLRLKVSTLTKELEQVQRLANRAMLKLLDNGDL